MPPASLFFDGLKRRFAAFLLHSIAPFPYAESVDAVEKEEMFMSRNLSPFAALTGDEKQIKWLEYQTIRLPYIQGAVDAAPPEAPAKAEEPLQKGQDSPIPRRFPEPPPEVPRVYSDFQKTRHSQYDAVIARMKQAEMNTTRYHSHID